MTEEQLKDANEVLNGMGLENVQDILFIKHGATNGEVLKAVFPGTESKIDERTGTILVKFADGTCKSFRAEWWNAKHKAESEVEI